MLVGIVCGVVSVAFCSFFALNSCRKFGLIGTSQDMPQAKKLKNKTARKKAKPYHKQQNGSRKGGPFSFCVFQ